MIIDENDKPLPFQIGDRVYIANEKRTKYGEIVHIKLGYIIAYGVLIDGERNSLPTYYSADQIESIWHEFQTA